ncbi:hypothetical protein [Nostoc sp.]|uniref:hypothetical protein n=1 Tax=Nostoc sp. TaxID=1180 RepID=UPI002FF82201
MHNSLMIALSINTLSDRILGKLIPEPKPGGRKREVDIWEVLNRIFYVLLVGD